MRNKFIIVGVGAILMLALIATGGWFILQQSQPHTSGQVIRVAKYYWPGSYWVEIANQKGWFKEAGLNVELVDTNTDYNQSLKDTADGKLDTVNFPPFDLIQYNAKGADLNIVFTSDLSSGADGIVAKTGLNTIKSLKGKKVAVTVGTYLDYILNVVLINNDLNPAEDIIKIDTTPEEAVTGFISGKYDAIVDWQPNLSEAANKGKGKIIFDSSQMPGINFGNWVFKRSFIEARPEDVQAFVGVWNKTTEFIIANPQAAYAIIAQIHNIYPEEVAALAATDRIIGLKDNLTIFTYGPNLGSIHGAISKINDYLFERKVITQKIDSLDIINASFMRNLTQ